MTTEKPKAKAKKPRKSPEQRLAELNEQQAKIEAELRQRKERILRQKRQQQAKITNEQRKRDTRKKVLVGAAVLAKVQAGDWTNDQLLTLLDNYLTRNDDRVLFDLPTLPEPEPEAQQGPGAGSSQSSSSGEGEGEA